LPCIYGNLTATETAPTSFLSVDDTAARSLEPDRAEAPEVAEPAAACWSAKNTQNQPGDPVRVK